MIKRTYFFSATVTIGNDEVTHSSLVEYKSLTTQPLRLIDDIKLELEEKYNCDSITVTAFNRV